MSDKDEIRELLARYCFALDADQFEEMAALFTEDGIGRRRLAPAPGERGS
jgi:hypothetical protein